MAVSHGFNNLVKAFLEVNGIELDHADNFGRTPLWWAKAQGYTQISRLLLDTAEHQGVRLADPITPLVSYAPNSEPFRECDVSSLGIAENCRYYACAVCNSGGFNICVNCKRLGAFCLVESHVLKELLATKESDLSRAVDDNDLSTVETHVFCEAN
ncbi:hypothetical protein BJX62DRAFT_217036 [Aspergillus germanicus]